MKTYKIICSIPTNRPWEAILEERIVDVENFNQLLMRGITVDEIKAGVRIVAIQERTNVGWLYLKTERSPIYRKKY